MRHIRYIHFWTYILFDLFRALLLYNIHIYFWSMSSFLGAQLLMHSEYMPENSQICLHVMSSSVILSCQFFFYKILCVPVNWFSSYLINGCQKLLYKLLRPFLWISFFPPTPPLFSPAKMCQTDILTVRQLVHWCLKVFVLCILIHFYYLFSGILWGPMSPVFWCYTSLSFFFHLVLIQ